MYEVYVVCPKEKETAKFLDTVDWFKNCSLKKEFMKPSATTSHPYQ